MLDSVESVDDPSYREALALMRHDGARTLADAARLLQRAEAGDFGQRHAVVMAIAAMREPGALDLLEAVALNPQPLPPGETPRHVEPHDVEDAVQGTIVALDAIDGIEALADDGHAPAVEALVRATLVRSNAIRAAALAALAAHPGRADHLRRAKSGLPPELQHLAGLRRSDVAQVPQVRDPRATLIGADSRMPAPPPLGAAGGSRPGASGRGPTVNRR